MKRPRSACPGKNEDILLPPAGLLTITSTSFFTLTLITILSGSILISSTSSATSDSIVDEINITVPISCSLTGTGMNTHNAEIPNGTYRQDIGTTTLKAFCNDNEGFAIYAAGYTGNEIGGTNSNKLVGTAASSNATIVTGTATSAGNPDTSNWAMKLTLGTDSGDTTGTNALTIDSAPNVDLPSQAEQSTPTASFSSYHVVPNEYVKVAHKNSATSMDETNGGVTLTTTYAAYISKTQAADTYSGQVIYTLVHPAYADSRGCNSNATTVDDVLCMQDFGNVNNINRAAIIASMVPEQQYYMRDSRDGKIYTVAKLKAGTDSVTGDPIYDIWMTQNLDLDINANVTYTNLDTDIGYNSNTNEYNSASWRPMRSTYATSSGHIGEWCVGGEWETDGYSSWCAANNTPESYDPGDLYWNGLTSDWENWDPYYASCSMDNHLLECNQSLNPIFNYTAPTSLTQYHLGNYYNWAAALATNDSSIYGTYNPTTEEYEEEMVEQSICPAGWTLPRVGNGEDSFWALWYGQHGYTSGDTIDGIELINNPLYFTLGGVYTGMLGDVGYIGGYWSPITVYEEGGSVNISIGSIGYFDAARTNNRSFGYPIRCIARPVSPSYSGSIGGSI